ncbi:hypothetical protein [Halorubrum sp. N11]|uniref:hypothetical protein n=1 Tax=Halorubrum sp. N11 TaxID=3402276 RepID=UPI003EB78275
MYEGDPLDHTDQHPPDSAPNDGKYRTPTWYAPFPKKDGYESNTREYGPVEQRAFDIQVTSPVEGVERLFHRKHLTAQFHAANQDYWEKRSPYTNDGGLLYDQAILDLFEEKLACEGVDPAESNIPENRLKTLFLRLAREQTGKAQIEYLKGLNTVPVTTHSALGYDIPSDVPNYDTLQRELRKLRDENEDEITITAFKHAVTRAVFAVYRAGISLPDAVQEKYGFTAVEPPLDERSVSRETEKEELRRFVKVLLDRTTTPLTFGREGNETKHDMKAFIGAFAASALSDSGLENVKNVFDWNYPRENIPGGGWAHNYISQRLRHDDNLSDFESETENDPLPSINSQFNAVHNRTLQLANTLGFWSDEDPINLGVDMFRIDWTGDSLDATIGRPAKSGQDDVTEQWTFVLAGGIDTESRFVLEGRWIETLTEYPTALSDILTNTLDTVDIDTIFVDAEIASGELIETLRRFAGDNWVISAPNRAVVKGLKRLTPEHYAAFARGVKWNVVPKPNIVTHPTNGKAASTVEINPVDVLTKEIRNENDGERMDIPLDTTITDTPTTQRSLGGQESLQWLTQEIGDLESEPGIGDEGSVAAYLTDRSLPENSATGIRIQYIQRWAIEETVNQVANDFMPKINSQDSKLRLYGTHISILFYNWHTLINRCLSPQRLRLDISYQELLRAIIDVCFSGETDDD